MAKNFFDDPDAGRVTMTKRRGSRGIRINVSAERGVRITLPYYSSYARAEKYFQEQKPWVMDNLQRLRSKMSDCLDRPENDDISGLDEQGRKDYVEALRAEAKEYLPGRLKQLAGMATMQTGLDFSFNDVTIKHNSTNWGSCSRAGNINLNLNLMRRTVPQRLRDYVMLHELAHLIYPDHSEAFHNLLERLCPGHRDFSHRLSWYRLV